ncbi:MAG: pseudouridine-5'-phosphate glycosidase [Firmicutes bacterium]|nr:pseudouridine-5'-phosphate glycosidase [Bacillota bacterium]MDD7603014.1 pseudouridine-5'-phosphate glycosidase [Bacillota bacterium]MDY5857269.1 pseudouridine-5'-phosphate glycosidase [Anaerovoracaceae bacterium]
MFKQFMDINPEVEKALEEGTPVIALESTIIAHGMPYPKNVETALAVEDVIRKNGAVPATIGIIGGRIKIGLTKEEVEYMATAKNVLKVSRRDFPLAVAQKADGATTVAGTMIAANMAGIRLFVTGGIGGVHRGAGESFDISADLEELKMTDVTVICAGVKSILDIAATLEYLETSGVPVITYGADEFPAFFSRKSGSPADCRLDTPKEIADLINAKDQMGLKGGVLVACPIPEEKEIPYEEIDVVIQQALKECEEQGIRGKKITPFLLSRVKDLTKGRSLEANIQLVLNNAEIGSKIAMNL